MKTTFYVKNAYVEATKALVRQHKSLRFLGNPIVGTYETEFRLEGDVQDFNSFNGLREALLDNHEQKEQEPDSFVEHFWSVVKRRPS